MKTELVTNFKRQATKIIAKLQRSSQPIAITEHGQKTAYLLGVRAFEKLTARMKILESIARGEKAIQEKRTLSQSEAKKKMKRWLYGLSPL
ncbi:MAG: type II toxin-antitoxin system Phd/YefM family antitoxin [Deltaproteobacteria bacterium]|nr:type II toxin-antitoxin system Phd/YefM family antitoxin [Deltaproteobacteria bacterium]